MQKTRRFTALALSMICISGAFSMPVNAQVLGSGQANVTYVDPSGAEFIGDPFYNPIVGAQTKGAFDSYNLDSDKESTQSRCDCVIDNGYDFVCKGWVNITDKKSGTDLKHSTTAALSNGSSGNMYDGAVREIGTGKVEATSESVHGWSIPRIFWDWVK